MKAITRTLLCFLLLLTLVVAEVNERKSVRRVDPEYPELARKMNLHGTVKLKIWIAADGSVRRLEYIGGHPVLAESALASVKQWRFEAAPSETTQVVEIKY